MTPGPRIVRNPGVGIARPHASKRDSASGLTCWSGNWKAGTRELSVRRWAPIVSMERSAVCPCNKDEKV